MIGIVTAAAAAVFGYGSVFLAFITTNDLIAFIEDLSIHEMSPFFCHYFLWLGSQSSPTLTLKLTPNHIVGTGVELASKCCDSDSQRSRGVGLPLLIQRKFWHIERAPPYHTDHRPPSTTARWRLLPLKLKPLKTEAPCLIELDKLIEGIS